jgi:hypothetical protein
MSIRPLGSGIKKKYERYVDEGMVDEDEEDFDHEDITGDRP